MKRRLSDHDELAFYWLALNTEREEDFRPALTHVHVEDGWAYATDAYRLLALPVDLDVNGAVHRSDAQAGGTVEVIPTPDGTPDFGMASLYKHDALLDITMERSEVDERLRPWLGRRIDSSTRSQTCVWFVPPMVRGDASEVVMPSGVKVGSGNVYSACLQAPYLAAVACGLSSTADAGVTITTGPGNGPIIVAPTTEDSFLDGWGLVMGIRTTFAQMPPKAKAS